MELTPEEVNRFLREHYPQLLELRPKPQPLPLINPTIRVAFSAAPNTTQRVAIGNIHEVGMDCGQLYYKFGGVRFDVIATYDGYDPTAVNEYTHNATSGRFQINGIDVSIKPVLK